MGEYNYGMYLNSSGRNRRLISREDSSVFKIELAKVEENGRTTLMMRNIPNKYTRDMILE